MKRELFFIIIAAILSLSLFLFTFTQIDLSLSLSQQSVIRNIQQQFQHIGFYNRQVAAAWITITFVGYVLFYIWLVFAAIKKTLSMRTFWILVGVMSTMLLFSYPAAFSYDVFNYIFTAKTVVLYEKNPYLVTPLQFQGIDPMLSFMRWTHLPSAYTPLWIIASLPFYLLSLQSLLLSFITMKLLPYLCYLGSIYIIGRIMDKVDKPMKLVSMVLFAMNPLILVESLVSGHNDMVMMLPALVAYLLYMNKQKLASFSALALSISIKLMTFPLLLPFFTGWKRFYAVVVLFGGICLVVLKRELLPWYAVWIIPFTALLPRMHALQIIVSAVSVGLLSTYIPMIVYGPVDSRVASLQQTVLLVSIVIGCMVALLHTARKRNI
jgi:hypothetical protein